MKKTYNVEVTETITNTYCLKIQATDEATAREAAIVFAELTDIADDSSIGYDVWSVEEVEEQNETE